MLRRALKYGAPQHFKALLAGVSGKSHFVEGWRGGPGGAGWQAEAEVTRFPSLARHGGHLTFGPPGTVAPLGLGTGSGAGWVMGCIPVAELRIQRAVCRWRRPEKRSSSPRNAAVHRPWGAEL